MVLSAMISVYLYNLDKNYFKIFKRSKLLYRELVSLYLTYHIICFRAKQEKTKGTIFLKRGLKAKKNLFRKKRASKKKLILWWFKNIDFTIKPIEFKYYI